MWFPRTAPPAAENMDAEALCGRAIGMAPKYAEAHSLLAWVLVRRASRSVDANAILAEASAEARIALRLDPRDSWAHVAHVLRRLRRYGAAERAIRRALEWNPNFALAYGSSWWSTCLSRGTRGSC